MVVVCITALHHVLCVQIFTMKIIKICRKYSYDMRNSTIVCITQAGKTALDMTNRFFKINSFGFCAFGLKI
jgi:hypothetical protein